jgi:RAB protein geranylgeranyltransferase component A
VVLRNDVEVIPIDDTVKEVLQNRMNWGTDWDQMQMQKASIIQRILERNRRFCLELLPMVLFSRGAMVELVANSGVGPSLEFQLVKSLYVFEDKKLVKVPGSKEDVFADSSISLIDKRRLMKFFTFASEVNLTELENQDLAGISFMDYLGQQKIPERLITIIMSAIVFEVDYEKVSTMSARDGLARTQAHLQSIGRYGPGAMLTALYGTGSELSQAFSRYCAIYGGSYILDFDIQSVQQDGDTWTVSDGSQQFSAPQMVLSSRFANYVSTECRKTICHRLICISDTPFIGNGEHSVICSPALVSSKQNGVFMIQMNSDNQVCPDGFCIRD